MTTTFLRLGVLLAALALCSAAPPVMIDGPSSILNGDRPHLSVIGLAPRVEVTVESFRYARVSVHAADGWSTERLLFHAQAQFWADNRGRVDLDRASPIAATWTGADPRGLLWSGAVVGRAPEPGAPTDIGAFNALSDNAVRLVVRSAGRLVATRDVRLTSWSEDVRFTTVRTGAVSGVFAAPAGARRRPTLILLHGSEGGSLDGAKEAAGRFASRGYAALALIYFAWPDQHLPDVPQSFAELPVERLAWARTWLARRPEADVGPPCPGRRIQGGRVRLARRGDLPLGEGGGRLRAKLSRLGRVRRYGQDIVHASRQGVAQYPLRGLRPRRARRDHQRRTAPP